MFIHLSRSEKAGSGVDKILKGWRELGLATPTVKEDTQPDYVVLTLPIGAADKTGIDTENDTENEDRKFPVSLGWSVMMREYLLSRIHAPLCGDAKY